MFILLQPTDVLHLLVQNPLLELNLGIGMQMLHRTAATDTGVDAGGVDTLRSGQQYRLGTQLIELLVSSHIARAGRLAGKGTVDKGDLAIDAGDTSPVMTQALHLQLDGLGGEFVATSCTAHEAYLWLQGTLEGGTLTPTLFLRLLANGKIRRTRPLKDSGHRDRR